MEIKREEGGEASSSGEPVCLSLCAVGWENDLSPCTPTGSWRSQPHAGEKRRSKHENISQPAKGERQDGQCCKLLNQNLRDTHYNLYRVSVYQQYIHVLVCDWCSTCF